MVKILFPNCFFLGENEGLKCPQIFLHSFPNNGSTNADWAPLLLCVFLSTRRPPSPTTLSFPSSGFRQASGRGGFSIRARNTAVFFASFFASTTPNETKKEQGSVNVAWIHATYSQSRLTSLCLDSPVYAVGISVVSRKQSISFLQEGEADLFSVRF